MNKTKELTIASMCLALGILLPQAFHMIPNAGNIFLPMHIPVLICGFVCGPLYALIVGVCTPILSHIVFQMPQTMMLAQMIVELGIYGVSSSLLNKVLNIRNEYIKSYICLVISMLMGRLTYGILNALIFKAGAYSMEIFLSTAFITSLPGIIIQLLIVPIIAVNTNKITSRN